MKKNPRISKMIKELPDNFAFGENYNYLNSPECKVDFINEYKSLVEFVRQKALEPIKFSQNGISFIIEGKDSSCFIIPTETDFTLHFSYGINFNATIKKIDFQIYSHPKRPWKEKGTHSVEEIGLRKIKSNEDIYKLISEELIKLHL